MRKMNFIATALVYLNLLHKQSGKMHDDHNNGLLVVVVNYISLHFDVEFSKIARKIFRLRLTQLKYFIVKQYIVVTQYCHYYNDLKIYHVNFDHDASII